MIVELGVAGDANRKIEWLSEARRSFDEFPLLQYVFLFNSIDSEGVWGLDFPTPDWRIKPEMLF